MKKTLNQIWADEMNGLIESGSYSKELGVKDNKILKDEWAMKIIRSIHSKGYTIDEIEQAFEFFEKEDRELDFEENVLGI